MDKKEALKLVSKQLPLFSVPKKFWKDKKFMLEAVKIDSHAYAYDFIDKSLKKDKKITLNLIKNNWRICKSMEKSFKKDKDIALQAVKKNGLALKYFEKNIKKDAKIVLEALKQNVMAFESYADKSLRKNKKIILEAVKRSGEFLKYADKILKRDKNIVLQAVKSNGSALKYADKIFRKNKKIVTEAIKSNGRSLKYVDKSFKKDKHIVLQAIKQNGAALEFADKKLKMNRNIVLQATKSNGNVFKFADANIKSDRKFVLQAVKRNGNVLYYADDSLKKDREIVLEAVKQDGAALEYADESIKKDKELIKESVGMENIQIKIFGPSRLDECFYFYLNKKDINNIRDNYLPKNTKPTLENVTQFLHQLPRNEAEQEFGMQYKTISAFENIHTGDVDIEIGSSGSTYKNKVNLEKIERVYEEIEFPDEAILLGRYYETISANPVDLGSWKGTYYFLEVDKIDFPLEDIQKHLIMKKVDLFDSVFHERPALKLNSGKILNFDTDSCYDESRSWSTNHSESFDFFIHHKFKSELEKFESGAEYENTKILCKYNSNENIFYNDDGVPTSCLNFYDEILNNDKKLMYDAVEKCGPSIRFVSKSLQKDFELAKLSISKADYSSFSFPYLDKTMKNDKSICLEAMRNHGSNLFYLDSKYKKDREIVLVAVKERGVALQFADDSLKKDKEIVLVAVKQRGVALQFADDSLKNDPDILAIVNKDK